MKNFKNVLDLEKKRIEILSKRIWNEYEDSAPVDFDLYRNILTEMIVVTKILKNSVYLEHLLDDGEYKPVLIPEAIKCLLRKNDAFMMTLQFREKHWDVLWMSPPYAEDCESYLWDDPKWWA